MEKNYEIIAVDFDGTLCYSSWPELGEPNQALIAYLKIWKNNGNQLTGGIYFFSNCSSCLFAMQTDILYKTDYSTFQGTFI